MIYLSFLLWSSPLAAFRSPSIEMTFVAIIQYIVTTQNICIRSKNCGPKVSILERFNCIYIIYCNNVFCNSYNTGIFWYKLLHIVLPRISILTNHFIKQITQRIIFSSLPFIFKFLNWAALHFHLYKCRSWPLLMQ